MQSEGGARKANLLWRWSLLKLGECSAIFNRFFESALLKHFRGRGFSSCRLRWNCRNIVHHIVRCSGCMCRVAPKVLFRNHRCGLTLLAAGLVASTIKYYRMSERPAVKSARYEKMSRRNVPASTGSYGLYLLLLRKTNVMLSCNLISSSNRNDSKSNLHFCRLKGLR